MRPKSRMSDVEMRKAAARSAMSATAISLAVGILFALGWPAQTLALIPVMWLLPGGILLAGRVNHWWWDRASKAHSQPGHGADE